MERGQGAYAMVGSGIPWGEANAWIWNMPYDDSGLTPEDEYDDLILKKE